MFDIVKTSCSWDWLQKEEVVDSNEFCQKILNTGEKMHEVDVKKNNWIRNKRFFVKKFICNEERSSRIGRPDNSEDP